MVDISKEAVEAMAMAADCDLCCVDTAIALRAQAARIAELEEAVRELDAIAREAHSARNDALREAAKVSAEDRENIVDEIESIICETHEMDVRDIDYAENIVSWLERHRPAALRAISEDSQ